MLLAIRVWKGLERVFWDCLLGRIMKAMEYASAAYLSRASSAGVMQQFLQSGRLWGCRSQPYFASIWMHFKLVRWHYCKKWLLLALTECITSLFGSDISSHLFTGQSQGWIKIKYGWDTCKQNKEGFVGVLNNHLFDLQNDWPSQNDINKKCHWLEQPWHSWVYLLRDESNLLSWDDYICIWMALFRMIA